MKSIRAALILSLLAMPFAAQADVVILTDGTRLEGRVERAVGNQNAVSFLSATGRIQIPNARIREIIEEPDAMDWTRIGNQFLNSRNFPAAVRNFQLALEADGDFEEAKSGLSRAQAAIAAEQAERDRQAQEALAREMEEVDRLIADERFLDAEGILNRVLTSNATEAQKIQAQRKMIELYLAWGFSRFDRLDRRGAEERYLRVLEMDPQNARARDQLLILWRDDPTKREEVLAAHMARLAENPNDLDTNRTVGELLFESQRFEEAIPPLRRVVGVPRFASADLRSRLLRSYRAAIEENSREANFERAVELFEDLLTFSPGEDQTQLMLLRFELARQGLAADDYDGQALLVQQLWEQGLTDFARREAELILRFDENNQIADAILRREADAEFRLVNDAFNARDFVLAQNLALRFTRTNVRYADLVERAQEIYRRSEIEARRMQAENRREAQRLAQQGIDLLNQARREIEFLQRDDIRTDTRPINSRQQAISLTNRSIQMMEIALELDPSLGPITGMDLNNRLNDARVLLNTLTARATPLPRPRNR